MTLLLLISVPEPHPSSHSSWIYLCNEQRDIGKRWVIFLQLGLFVILIFILKDAFQIFKCMYAHIAMPWDELQTDTMAALSLSCSWPLPERAGKTLGSERIG